MGFLFGDDFMSFYKDATEYVYIIYTHLIMGNGVMFSWQTWRRRVTAFLLTHHSIVSDDQPAVLHFHDVHDNNRQYIHLMTQFCIFDRVELCVWNCGVPDATPTKATSSRGFQLECRLHVTMNCIEGVRHGRANRKARSTAKFERLQKQRCHQGTDIEFSTLPLWYVGSY